MGCVKGDGNCFLRGYVFGIFEGLLGKASTEASGFKGILTAYFFLITDKNKGLVRRIRDVVSWR